MKKLLIMFLLLFVLVGCGFHKIPAEDITVINTINTRTMSSHPIIIVDGVGVFY